ncbi:MULTISPECIES: MarR family winged helix-turn-helix transcriptional regulator [Nitratireductor]|uniref:MarR family winged helix-turn-helix transcriptional regulator n=1 Tax=Nitratireductor TaxID=245876 RepID=UPI001FEF7E32|nr:MULTISPECIES: MarR family transcriptional regulator [Nitratireductor]MDJ1463839.1 MarR family transcriptional regulator [Nitratireductor sp. GZWM139]
MTNWAARLFARAIDRNLRDIGVTSGMLPVFFALGEGAWLSQKALTKSAGIEQPTMAATLLRMERDGLIERRADPEDRRSRLIGLTPDAMEKAVRVRQAVGSVNGLALEALTDAERAHYLALLEKIVSSLQDSLSDEG